MEMFSVFWDIELLSVSEKSFSILCCFFKVGKTFELLNCDQHKNIIIKSGRDPGNVRPDITHQVTIDL